MSRLLKLLVTTGIIILILGAGSLTKLQPVQGEGPNAAVPEELNLINISLDVLGASGTLQITYNITALDSNYPDCSIVVLKPNGQSVIGKLVLPDAFTLNKSGTKTIAYSGLQTGVYWLNLVCSIKNQPNMTYCDAKNFSAHYNPESGGCDLARTYDRVPVFVNTSATNAVQKARARIVGMKEVQDYLNCKDMPMVNCAEWQKHVTNGRTWNLTLGVPV